MRAYSENLVAGALTAAITTTLEFSAGPTPPCVITRATMAQQGNTTSAQQAIELLRRTTASTNVTTPNVNPMLATDTATAASVRGLATVLGTAGAVLYSDAFNWQNGWLYLPVPEERITVAPSAIFSQHLPVAPGSTQTIDCTMDFLEIA